ncbi:MarR family transcriptional regulator [Hymenobacter sp. 15J16-1T3B]|uniref:MarR family winged helix-turn-helix transcriptional regulator n=1 Tax=Hymenobacter sp. 15J16-1T3B TaxID=2886941 RepID=UPI001D1229C8|nr:MarR family transcriptional regulator [Hymenobacter sp. 15J16-1T3B]MCC3157569.1 MarR family transcriptional regulator [Hymenobacter sp. 15J16-1T3B]
MALPTDPLFTFEGPDDNPGYLLAQATAHWQRSLTQVLTPMNLTPSQFLLLAAVQRLSGQQTEPVTQAHVAQHAHYDKMTTSKIVRTLEEKGLLQRPTSEQDARARSLQLTPMGLKAVVRAAWALEEFDQQFFGSKAAALIQTLQSLLPPRSAGDAPEQAA